MEDQIRARLLTIAHANYWPGITHSNVYDLELDMWLSLALSSDKQVAEAKAAAERAKSKRGS